MPVVGRNAHVISDTGRIVKDNLFNLEYEAMQIPIIDANVRYDCTYNVESYIKVIRNALYVPSMRRNLLPIFMLREAGSEFHKRQNIQVKNPTVDDHSIYLP